jgi:hypothetical protein
MTEDLGMGKRAEERAKDAEAEAFNPYAAENIAPLVVWLGSVESDGVTGRVFNVNGGRIAVAEGWAAGPSVDKGERWDPAELGAVVPELVAQAAKNADMSGTRR